jgi:hypothetical protein
MTLGKRIKAARGATPRKTIEFDLDLPSGTLSQYEGGRLPPIGRLRSLCERIKLDFGESLTYLVDPKNAKSENHGIKLMASDYSAIPQTLIGFSLATLIMGDRRSRPPNTLADVLAADVSSGDLFFYRGCYQIWHDKIAYMLPAETLTKVFLEGILTLGSPAVNLCSRIVNRAAAFRFFVPPEIDALERQLRDEFKGRPQDLLSLHADKLEKVIDGNRGHGFIDMFSAGVSHQENGPYQYGVLSLAQHPWDSTSIAILAGGQRGPATASVLKLLSEPDCFVKRPLGGIFRVQVPDVLGIDQRYPRLHPEWVTEVYSFEEYEAAMESHTHCSSEWAEGIKLLKANINRKSRLIKSRN